LFLLVGVSTLSAAASNEKVGDRLMRSQDDGQLRLIVNHAGASSHSQPVAAATPAADPNNAADVNHDSDPGWKPVDELKAAEAKVARAQSKKQREAEASLDSVSRILQTKGHRHAGVHKVPYNLKIVNPNFHGTKRNVQPENKLAPKPKPQAVQQLASSISSKVMLASAPSLLQEGSDPFIPAPFLVGEPAPAWPAGPEAQPAWPVGQPADLTKVQVPADVGETVTLAPPEANQLAHSSVNDLSAAGSQPSSMQQPLAQHAVAASVAWPIEGTSAEKPLQAVPAPPTKLEAPPTKLETTFTKVSSPTPAVQGIRYSDGSVDIDHGVSASPSPHPSPTPLAQ